MGLAVSERLAREIKEGERLAAEWRRLHERCGDRQMLRRAERIESQLRRRQMVARQARRA